MNSEFTFVDVKPVLLALAGGYAVVALVVGYSECVAIRSGLISEKYHCTEVSLTIEAATNSLMLPSALVKGYQTEVERSTNISQGASIHIVDDECE